MCEPEAEAAAAFQYNTNQAQSGGSDEAFSAFSVLHCECQYDHPPHHRHTITTRTLGVVTSNHSILLNTTVASLGSVFPLKNRTRNVFTPLSIKYQVEN